MKILIYTDVHMSDYSSIVRSIGNKYTTRLENCINSVNWAEDLAVAAGCDEIFCLGDFFDAANLSSQTLTALQEIKWANLPHTYVVGNHEMGINDLSFSSMHTLSLCPNINIIDKDTVRYVDNNALIFIPYKLKCTKEDLLKVLAVEKPVNKKIVFSHNDIAGIQLGKFISKAGFELDDISNNCDLFLNGHLHNGTKLRDGIINIGNLTGQNFSEDATKYDHTAFILDTNTLKVDVFENPYAFNFYKIDMTEEALPRFKNNSVISIKEYESNISNIREELTALPQVIASRFVTVMKHEDNKEVKVEELYLDHLEKFSEFVLDTIGSTDLIHEELQEVLK